MQMNIQQIASPMSDEANKYYKERYKTTNIKKKLSDYLFITIMILLSLIILFPILFLVLTSVKSPEDFFGKSVFSLPEHLKWENFTSALIDGKLWKYMLNGLFVCGIKVPLGIIIESLAAFAITRFNIRHANKIFILFLIGMMIPMQICLVPINVGLRAFGIFNTYLGLIITYLGFGIPFGILIMRGFFRTIPKEMDEAAIIDGCTPFSLFSRILFPLSKPAIATLLILDTLATWNEYLLISVLITEDRKKTVPAGLLSFIGENDTAYGLLTAGVLITIIPVLIVFILFQRYFIEGMSGAIKG